MLELRRSEEAQEKWEFSLDGTLGWKEWRSLAAAYERALQQLPTMPRLWLDYLTLFVHPACPPTISKTHARRTFDRALRTLPPSLHLHIWRWYLRWAEICGSEVAQRVWCRYLRIDSSLSEPYVAMLLEMPEQLRIADGHANNIDGSIARHDEDEKDDDDDDSLTPVQERRVLEACLLYTSPSPRDRG